MQYNLGRVLPKFRGQYRSSVNYVPLDIVYYNGSSYVCKMNATNKLPTNTTYWQIVAMKGELSPTLSQAQVEQIIQQITSSGNYVTDASYVHTDNNFTTELKDKLDNVESLIGNATLTISKNNTPIGTFSSNATSNATINIQVPTSIQELTGDDTFMRLPNLQFETGTTIDISNLKGNMVYIYQNPITRINIASIQQEMMDFKVPASVIDFETGSSLGTITLPNDLFYDFDPTTITTIVKPNNHYRFWFEYGVLRIQTLYKI